MRKIFIFFLFGTLFSCQSVQKPDDKITVTLAAGGTSQERVILEKQLKAFEEAYPKVKVRLLRLPPSSSQQHDIFVTYLSAKDRTIDVLNLDIIWIGEFAAARWLMPLEPYWVKEDQEDFLSGPLEGCTYQGRIYAVPWFTSCGLFYYRKDVLERYGFSAPKNFDEMEKIFQKIIGLEPDWIGFVWQGAQYEGLVCNFYEAFWSTGSYEKALGQMSRSMERGLSPRSVLSFKEEDVRRLFSKGKALFMRNWPYAWRMLDHDDSNLKGKVGIASIPWSDATRPGISCLGGWNLAISHYSTQPEWAWKLIDFLTQPERMKERCLVISELPTRISLLKDPVFEKQNPYWDEILAILKSARARPQTAFYSEWSQLLQLESSKFLVSHVKNLSMTIEKITKKWTEISELEKKQVEKKT